MTNPNVRLSIVDPLCNINDDAKGGACAGEASWPWLTDINSLYASLMGVYYPK